MTLVEIGYVELPQSCEKYYTYTSRLTCQYAEQYKVGVFPGELVYKDLKTLICSLWEQKFTVNIPILQSAEYEIVEVPSCELIMGKRGKWSSFVKLQRKENRMYIYFDQFMWNLFKPVVTNPPSEEILKRIAEAVKKLGEIYGTHSEVKY